MRAVVNSLRQSGAEKGEMMAVNKHYTKRRELTAVEIDELKHVVRTTWPKWLPLREPDGTELRKKWFSIQRQLFDDGWLSDLQIAELKRCQQISDRTRIRKFNKIKKDIEQAIKLKIAVEESVNEGT